MENLLPFLQFVALAAIVVLGLRWYIRRPRNVSQVDPRGVRTVALFSGGDPEFFRDDRKDEPFVGIRLFAMICDELAHHGFMVTNRRNVQCAQGADCVVENHASAWYWNSSTPTGSSASIGRRGRWPSGGTWP